MSQLRVVANISKGSPLTGSAWIDILFGGISVVEHAEITAPFNPDPNQVTPNPIEFTVDYNSESYQTLTVVNSPKTIGPIQIYAVNFYTYNEFPELAEINEQISNGKITLPENIKLDSEEYFSLYEKLKEDHDPWMLHSINWQSAIKGKPLRFGGQPNITITNPHLTDPAFAGWCSIPDVSPGMSITWGLPDLVTAYPI
jgi:hypothetical protein